VLLKRLAFGAQDIEQVCRPMAIEALTLVRLPAWTVSPALEHLPRIHGAVDLKKLRDILERLWESRRAECEIT